MPVNYPKDSLLQDLAYFGFDNIPNDAISNQWANFDAGKHLRVCKEKHHLELAKIDREIGDLQKLRDFKEIAFSCFKCFCDANPTRNQHVCVGGLPHMDVYFAFQDGSRTAATRHLSIDDKKLFDACLAHYGLRYVSHSARSATLAPVDAQNATASEGD